MKARRLVVAVVSSLMLSGTALAQGGMGMGMGMGAWGDGDAKITKDEFVKHAEERFKRMDVNKDGVIDATDRKAMRERMRECQETMGDMGPGMMGYGKKGSGMMGPGMMGGAGETPAKETPAKPAQ